MSDKLTWVDRDGSSTAGKKRGGYCVMIPTGYKTWTAMHRWPRGWMRHDYPTPEAAKQACEAHHREHQCG